MKHTVRLKGVIVGHSDLEHIEPGTGRAWGPFRPGLGYDLVQPVFRLFARAVPHDGSPRDDAMLERYHDARDKLELLLEDQTGKRIGTSTIHIADYSVEEGERAIQLDVLIRDETYWRHRLSSA